VEGDAALFAPEPRHQAGLLLPALAGAPVVEQASGRQAIEIRLSGSGVPPRVLLSGPDRAAMAALWASISQEGRIGLPRLDARSYGEFRLAVLPGGRAGGTLGGQPSRYRYEFEDDRLVSARAWGPAAELVFTVAASDALGCESEATASLGPATLGPAAGIGPAGR
jgi:hypothetical protein